MKLSRRIEMRTLKKILEFSLSHGPQKKTNMATSCKMSYSRFIPVLNVMILLGLLEMCKTPTTIIVITQSGKNILDQLQNNKDINF